MHGAVTYGRSDHALAVDSLLPPTASLQKLACSQHITASPGTRLSASTTSIAVSFNYCFLPQLDVVPRSSVIRNRNFVSLNAEVAAVWKYVF